MASTKFAPPSVPQELHPNARQYIDEQMTTLALLINGAIQDDDVADLLDGYTQAGEAETITGAWAFENAGLKTKYLHVNREANAVTQLLVGEPTVTRGNPQNGSIIIYGEDSSSVIGSLTLSHDGVNAAINSGKGDLIFSAAGGDFILNQGLQLRFYSAGNSVYSEFQGSATAFNISAGGHDTAQFIGYDDVRVRDGALFRIQDAGDTDYAQFAHNGVDFLTTFVNTAEWDIGPITAVNIDGNVALPFDHRYQIGAAASGFASVVGTTQNTDAAALDYRTYLAYDCYWNDSADQWEALRTTLGRKAMLSMGYHQQALEVSYFDGTVSSPWADSDWIVPFKVDFGNSRVEVRAGYDLRIAEKAAAGADVAGYGQLWVKNTTPCELWFTDDAGTDTQIV